MLTGSALHDMLLEQLRFSNPYSTVTGRFFKAFYENGMEPIWILVYDIETEHLSHQTSFYRRMAMGQGMQCHMDAMPDFERGWS